MYTKCIQNGFLSIISGLPASSVCLYTTQHLLNRLSSAGEGVGAYNRGLLGSQVVLEKHGYLEAADVGLLSVDVAEMEVVMGVNLCAASRGRYTSL